MKAAIISLFDSIYKLLMLKAGEETRNNYLRKKGVKIGKNCKISSHSFICEGVNIDDDVFIGHGVKFINDKIPKSAKDGKLLKEGDWKVVPTIIKKGASLGSNSTILCGITIGENAVVGAGAVVTKDVQPNTIVVGNPAKLLRNV